MVRLPSGRSGTYRSKADRAYRRVHLYRSACSCDRRSSPPGYSRDHHTVLTRLSDRGADACRPARGVPQSTPPAQRSRGSGRVGESVATLLRAVDRENAGRREMRVANEIRGELAIDCVGIPFGLFGNLSCEEVSRHIADGELHALVRELIDGGSKIGQGETVTGRVKDI